MFKALRSSLVGPYTQGECLLRARDCERMVGTTEHDSIRLKSRSIESQLIEESIIAMLYAYLTNPNFKFTESLLRRHLRLILAYWEQFLWTLVGGSLSFTRTKEHHWKQLPSLSGISWMLSSIDKQLGVVCLEEECLHLQRRRP